MSMRRLAVDRVEQHLVTLTDEKGYLPPLGQHDSQSEPTPHDSLRDLEDAAPFEIQLHEMDMWVAGPGCLNHAPSAVGIERVMTHHDRREAGPELQDVAQVSQNT